MPEESTNEYEIEQFTLDKSDFGKIADLIKNVFIQATEAEGEGGTISFTPETFNIMFGSPYQPKNLFFRAIHKNTGEIVGFLGGIPRDLSYKGKIYKFGVPSWVSVHWQHQRKGLALQLGLKMLEVARGMGFEGGISFFEPEAHGIDSARALCRKTGIPMYEVQTIKKFLIRVFDASRIAKAVKLKGYEKLALRLIQGVPKIHNPRVRKFQLADADHMFELMRDHVERNELAIVRNRDDFIWYLQQPGVNCVVHEGDNHQVDGFIVAWEMQLAGFGNVVPCGWLDLVHTYRLPLAEAKDLCKYLCQTAKEHGWVGLQTPYMPYFDPTPFKRAKFVFFPKKLIVALFPLKELPLPEHTQSFYFDWR